jgi:hypothetical protein
VKSISFYAEGNRSGNVLHIETDGCTVNIHVGLTDAQGRQVTRIDVSPDDESRGGDGSGYVWRDEHANPAQPYDWRPGAVPIRVVRENRD